MNGKRWYPQHKIAILSAIKLGETTEEDVCKKYGISFEELESWRRLQVDYNSPSLTGLRLSREVMAKKRSCGVSRHG